MGGAGKRGKGCVPGKTHREEEERLGCIICRFSGRGMLDTRQCKLGRKGAVGVRTVPEKLNRQAKENTGSFSALGL